MQENNKKIARNTIIVYIRLIITTLIGLVSSRFVLQLLGVSDYGLYNIVGSVIVMFSFLTSALYGTTTRFINYEQGKENGNINRIFNISIVLHIIFSAITFLILETIGVIYVIYFLNVDVGKENDAMFVFQISTITACIGVQAIPYQSLFVVNEKFSIIAIADLVFSILKFITIISLFFYSGNALRLYAICMALVTLMNAVLYIFLSFQRWPEVVKWQFVKGLQNYKEMFVFNNYNLLGAASLILRNQGGNMLINFYFGTIVNAAYAVSFSVQNYINSFVGNFDTASSPQITQNMGHGNMDRSFFLATNTCRICILLMLLLYFPISCELDFLLHLWLGDNVPDGSMIFCRCSLLIALVSATSTGLIRIIHGKGELKWFTLQFCILYVVALLLGGVLYYYDFPPYTILLLFLLVDIISRFNQLYLLRKQIHFDAFSFVKKAYFKPMLVFISGEFYLLVINTINCDFYYFHYINIILSLLYTIGTIFFLGFYNNERKIVLSYIKRRF